MAEALARDRLYPSLLDRLTDEDPSKQVESREARASSMARLRESVLRDLNWLFNATQTSDDLSDFPEVASSVLNYGLPPLSGHTASTIDPLVLQQRVRQAILDHEPRILPETLNVEVVVTDVQLDHHNQIGVRISGQMWAQPVPLELMLHTDIDLETGRVAVRELDR